MTINVPDWLLYGLGGCIISQIPWLVAFIWYNLKVRRENSQQNLK